MTFLLRSVGFYLLAARTAVNINVFRPRLMLGNPLDPTLTRYRSEDSPAQLHVLATASGFDTHQG